MSNTQETPVPRLSTAQIKELSGSEPITYRKLYGRLETLKWSEPSPAQIKELSGSEPITYRKLFGDVETL